MFIYGEHIIIAGSSSFLMAIKPFNAEAKRYGKEAGFKK
jgi:hypothetical protein